MSELKACPFCGKAPFVRSLGAEMIICPNGCVFMATDDRLERWNTRPLEDALTARIAELEGALKKIAELENKWDAPNDFSNELQKIAQEVLK